jgi:hypothetical protein
MTQMGSKRSLGSSRPNSRFTTRAQDREGLSPGMMRPPIYHQSGCGCTQRRPRRILPSGFRTIMSVQPCSRYGNQRAHQFADSRLTRANETIGFSCLDDVVETNSILFVWQERLVRLEVATRHLGKADRNSDTLCRRDREVYRGSDRHSRGSSLSRLCSASF